MFKFCWVFFCAKTKQSSVLRYFTTKFSFTVRDKRIIKKTTMHNFIPQTHTLQEGQCLQQQADALEGPI